MEDFTSPAYFTALFAAIKYGLGVLVGMCVAASAFVFASGGSAAASWDRSEAAHH